MAKYVLDIKPSARKELENLSDSLIARLMLKIGGLAADPRPPGCRKLRGYKDLWRVVYIINDERKTVSVTRIAHRREVYEEPAIDLFS